MVSGANPERSWVNTTPGPMVPHKMPASETSSNPRHAVPT